MQSVNDSKHGTTNFGYTKTGHLELTKFADGTEEFRKSDAVGNLFESKDLKDREYGYGGRLEKKGSWYYKYDEEGFLIEKHKGSGGLFSSSSDHWKYEWNAQGMLETVKRPDGEKVYFTYDALGRRLTKKFKNTTTKWLWDGNVPLHEWKENSRGEILGTAAVGSNGLITWVFEENSYIPTAKLKNDKKFSILVDHLGTPTSMHNEEGNSVWERSLDSFGRLKDGEHGSCPFMYQGQYYDQEIELAYNRFRYYSPETGTYISKDPIGLEGGLTFYGYVDDPNSYLDIFGLKKSYHANDRRNSKKQHGYEIYNKKGEVVKTGVSSGRIRKDGQSSRAEKQVRDWNKDTSDPNGPYTSKVKKEIPSQDGARGKIYDWEQGNVNKHADTLDPQKHTLPQPNN